MQKATAQEVLAPVRLQLFFAYVSADVYIKDCETYAAAIEKLQTTSYLLDINLRQRSNSQEKLLKNFFIVAMVLTY